MSLVDVEGERSAELIVLLTTVADEAAARALARVLLEAELVACVQLSRIESLYRWEGEVAEEPEIRLTIKTPVGCRDAAMAAIAAHHPYDVPEVIALEIRDGHPEYLAWIAESVR